MDHLQNEIERALKTLSAKELVLYPTDTVWGIGCDATAVQAVKEIYALKDRPDSKALICLVSDVKMLREYVEEVPEKAVRLIEASTKPTTIIYDRPRKVAKNLVAEDNTLAIRVCRDSFCQSLIRGLGRPIVSTSANVSGQPTPKSFAQIAPEIVKGVNYVVNLRREIENPAPSAIVKIERNGRLTVIRE